MNVHAWRTRNIWHRVKGRITHPWPWYKRQRSGGIAVVVNRADGTTEDLGRVSDLYMKRWGVSTK